MCGSMVDIQSATAEIGRGKKMARKKEGKKKPQDENIMSASATQGCHINCISDRTAAVTRCHIKPLTRMWANAHHDGRPAEYRWRPVYNAKFG